MPNTTAHNAKWLWSAVLAHLPPEKKESATRQCAGSLLKGPAWWTQQKGSGPKSQSKPPGHWCGHCGAWAGSGQSWAVGRDLQCPIIQHIDSSCELICEARLNVCIRIVPTGRAESRSDFKAGMRNKGTQGQRGKKWLWYVESLAPKELKRKGVLSITWEKKLWELQLIIIILMIILLIVLISIWRTTERYDKVLNMVWLTLNVTDPLRVVKLWDSVYFCLFDYKNTTIIVWISEENVDICTLILFLNWMTRMCEKHLDRDQVTPCIIGNKPSLLHDSRRDTDKTIDSKYIQ